ncbi:MAG: OmpA family protein [Paludibacteraceae bacterium]|nr:OmpA family protein [Paludibacteraceae bacterium]
MKTILRKLFVLILVMSLGAPMHTTMLYAAPAQEMTAAQKAKAKEQAKKQKEREKAAAQKQKEREKAAAQKEKERAKAQADKQKAQAQAAKEAEKKKAEAEKKRAEAAKDAEKKREAAAKQSEARQKEAAKAQAERQKEQAKAQAERQKELDKKQAEKERIAAENEKKAEKLAAQEAKQKEAYYAQFEDNGPKTEAVSLFNLYGRVGYAAMFDKIDLEDRKLIGGPGAGLGIGYELEYGHFRFNTSLDFTWLNSSSKYGFMETRPLYMGNTGIDPNRSHHYFFSGYREMRNLGYVGVPIMLGGQFDRYYFAVGAKVGFNIIDSYSGKGKMDIMEEDTRYASWIPVEADKEFDGMKGKTGLSPLDLSVCAEFGIDLDEWLQKQPDPKKKVKVKPGERLPFGREHIHYRVSVFADYSVLNNKNEHDQLPLTFSNENGNPEKYPTGSHSLVSLHSGSPLNNLFVGVKFTIQFEVPGKQPRQVPPPASYADIRVVDNANSQLLANSTIEIKDTDKDRIKLREKVLKQGTHKQRLAMGNFSVYATAENYYPLTYPFSLDSAGITLPVELRLNHVPVFRVTVANKETGVALPAKVQIRKRGTEENRYLLETDSARGASSAMLSDSIMYSLHIEQMGYEPYDALIANIGDSMHVQLTPIKKGEVFIMNDLFFASNRTRILSSSEKSLNDLYMFMQRNPEVRIKIMGHTDSVGKDAANQKLSEGRANAVRDDLIERGVAPERIEAIGYGESRPIDTNDTEEGRQNNRRVEIEIM